MKTFYLMKVQSLYILFLIKYMDILEDMIELNIQISF